MTTELTLKRKASLIRHLMLYCPNFVKQAAITDKDRDLYFEVASRGLSGMKSAELAEESGINIQCAHNQLNKLAKKKYLKKVEGVHESGGKEYTFVAIEF